MRTLLLVSAVLLVAAAPPAKPKTPSEIVAGRASGAWRDIRRRRSAGHGPQQRGAGRDPARARVRAGARRQHPRAGARAAGGAAPQSIGSRTITSSSGAITKATKPLPAGVVAKPPAEYHRALKGLAVRPLGLRRRLCAERGFRRGLADRVRSARRARRTSRIATAMSASAATCRPTRARAASSTP